MDPDDFNDPQYERRRSPWFQYSRMPTDGTDDLRGKESEMVMSARRARAESRLRTARHRNLLGAHTTEERKRAHMHPYWWTPEILSLAGGMLCLLAIVILLWRCDGRPPPAFRAGVTLNTVLAFLTSLTKALFLVPIIEGLGQLKWMWFLSPKYRLLSDLQVFDEATRGGLGGLRLLLSFKGFLASFGALIMMSGLLTSTLTQQAVTYPQFEAESHGSATDKAEIARATTFSAYNGNTIALAAYDSLREQQAIFNGAFQAPAEDILPVAPVCSSGECRWPPYGTLAICGGVANLTALGNTTLLESLGEMAEKRLSVLFDTTRSTADALGYGDRYFSIVPQVYPIVIGALDRPTGAFNASVTALMASDSFVAYADELLNNSFPFDVNKLKYLEVAFWWCTKSLETNVTAGKAVTTEIAIRSELARPLDTVLNQPWHPEYLQCYTQGTCNATYGDKVASLAAPLGLRDEEYTVHLWTGLSASALLATSMFDSVFMDRTRGNVASNGAGGIAQAMGLSILGDFLSTVAPAPEEQMGAVRRLVANVAQSTTNLIRSGNTRLNKTDASAVVTGIVKTQQPFVVIRWEWMAMVAAQLGLTALFLVITMIYTHRAQMQVIKCSSLATLCALDSNTRGHIGGIDDLEGLKEKAKCLAVRLQRGASGIALWLGMLRDGQSEVQR